MYDLTVQHVSKKYAIRIASRLNRFTRRSTEFWALQDINFDVPGGQALGIAGTIQHVSKTRAIQPAPLGHFLGFRELRCSEWGRLFSLRTRFPAGSVGRNAGRGQEWPPHANHEKALTRRGPALGMMADIV